MKVEKRSGKIVEFENSKIVKAVKKAFGAVEINIQDEKINELLAFINTKNDGEIKKVEDIQDSIVEWLHINGYHSVGIAFTKYRERRAIARDTSFNSVNLVNEYLCQLDDMAVHENSSTMYSLQGLNNHLFSSVSEKYWLSLYSDEIKNAYNSGRIHIHDLGVLGIYCAGWDLKVLIEEGFGGVSGKPESKPPKHLSSALSQANNFIFTLQGECYSDDTEVLTNNGWKYFYDLLDNDYVCTINMNNSIIEYQKPINYFINEYEGIMYNFKSKKIDLLVTPNHNMLVKQYYPSKNKSEYEYKLVKAIDFNKTTNFIPKKSNWIGEDVEYFNLPQITINKYHNLGDKYTERTIESVKIKMEDWLAFFGFWLAEGCTSKTLKTPKNRCSFYDYAIRISQNEGDVSKEFEKLLDKLPFKYNKISSKSKIPNSTTIKNEYVIYNKQLFLYLEQFGKSGDKFIPQEIKKLKREFLEILIYWMMEGDGHYGKDNSTQYYTKSKLLADDVQEVFLKLGYNANIYEKYKNNKKSKWYCVSVSKSEFYKFTDDIKQISYKGKTYCVEVPNHTLYVRRLGKSAWCGNCAGAQAFSNFNTLLAPFVREDNLSYNQVKQEIQQFIFNLNISTRVGFQAPFSNLTLDLDSTKVKFADEPCIVGGEMKEYSYGECNKEATWINQAVVEVMGEGDKLGAMLSYPIVTFNVTKDFPWQNKLGKTILDSTGKYGSYYFSNKIDPDFCNEEITSMCCRLKISHKEIEKHLREYTGGLDESDYDKTHRKGHGFFGASANTGSIGVVTLNIPAIMHDAKEKGGDWDEFLTLVKYYMDLAIESLMKKRKIVEYYADKGLYPYLTHYLREVKKRTGHYFTQHFSTICPNGIHEALYIYGFKDGIMCDEGLEKAIQLLKFMNEYTVELQKEFKVLINLEQAPAESAGVKLCQKSGVDPLGNGYYTNSSWQPAESKIDLIDLIDMQGKLNVYYTGGSSMHTYTDSDLVPIANDLQKIIMYAFTETKIPYMTISPVFSVCHKCGRMAGKHHICPKCGSKKIEIYERIVGYYRPHTNWNKGRLKESEKRNYLKLEKKS